MSEFMKPILARLAQARKRCGYSQADIAKLLSNTSQTMISAIEMGKVRLSVETLYLLASHYDVSPLWILTGDVANQGDIDMQHLLIDLDAAAKYIQHAKDTLKEHSDD